MGNEFCDPFSGPNYPKWTPFDSAIYWLAPAFVGGGDVHLDAYRDAWVSFNKIRIKSAAKDAGIADDFLGCVAYGEVGGKSVFYKRHVFLPARHYYWAGPEWDRNFKVLTRPPGYTSVGSVKIQIREAAKTMGLDGDKLTYKQQHALSACLELDIFNLIVSAKLLRNLIRYDFPDADPLKLTDEQWIISGSRYNRGTARTLADYYTSLRAPIGAKERDYTSYGRAMLRHRQHVRQLLMLGP